MNFDGEYLRNGWADFIQNWNQWYPTLTTIYMFVSVEGVSSYNYVKRGIATFVKYALVCHLPQVSWATQHITVYLDPV